MNNIIITLSVTVAIAALSPPSRGQCVPVLANSSNYGQAINPSGMTVADVNADGHLDVLTANYGPSTVEIRLGNGDGTFQQAVSVGAGCAVGVTTGDVNGDGHIDVGVANSCANLEIMRGDGSGNFLPLATLVLSGNPRDIVFLDVNNDSFLDIAAVGETSDLLTIFMGNGSGGFSRAASFAMDDEPIAILAAELSGDDRTDLAVACKSGNSIVILTNSLTEPSGFTVSRLSGTVNPRSFVAADVDQDQTLDLVIVDNRQIATIYWGVGDGTFPSTTSLSVAPTNPSGFTGTSVAVADVNLDGRLDIIAGGFGVGYLTISGGIGARSFELSREYTHPGHAELSQYSVNELFASDFNSDSLTDFVCGNGRGSSVSVWTNRSVGLVGDSNRDGLVSFSDIIATLSNWSGAHGLGDANRDGIVNFTDISLILANWLSECP